MMKTKIAIPLLILLVLLAGCSSKKNEQMGQYDVTKLDRSMVIDGNWNKPHWHNVNALEIKNRMGDKPLFTPGVEAKMMYDDENLYVIFRVNDKYVKSIVTEINGPVYEEPAVEFFFSPDTAFPHKYFNLEINCIGTPLMHYNDFKNVIEGRTIKESTPLDEKDIRQVEIASTISKDIDPLTRIIDEEITEPVIWTIEYRIPLSILENYSKVVRPQPGVEWKANFYKIAEKGTNVHFFTWSPVNNAVPNFHLPQFFGDIIFR